MWEVQLERRVDSLPVSQRGKACEDGHLKVSEGKVVLYPVLLQGVILLDNQGGKQASGIIVCLLMVMCLLNVSSNDALALQKRSSDFLLQVYPHVWPGGGPCQDGSHSARSSHYLAIASDNGAVQLLAIEASKLPKSPKIHPLQSRYLSVICVF